MTVEAQVIDAESTEIGTEIVPVEHAALFKTDDPVEVIAQATKAANALKDVVASRGLISNIRGREHPKVEAWQLLGSMLGVHPVPVSEPQPQPWPDPIPAALKAAHDKGLSFGFVASYTAVKNGEVVGGGQARCTRTESAWKDRDDFALASMAQTRAISKALSGPLRFVMVLAGYEATPAEEMPAATAPQPYGPPASGAQRASMLRALGYLIGRDPDDALNHETAQRLAERFGGYYPEAAVWAVGFAADHCRRWADTLPAEEPET